MKKNKKIFWGIVFYFICIIVLLIYLVLISIPKPYIDENDNVVKICISLPYGDENAYYISINSNGVLYYRVGQSNCLLKYLYNYQIEKEIIGSPIIEKEIQLKPKKYRKVLRMLAKIEKTNNPCSKEKFGTTAYDATYRCFWYNNQYYDVSIGSIVNKEGYDCYSKLVQYLFDNMKLPDEYYEEAKSFWYLD